ncbi:hypothetical protein CH063_15578, partial [Colletotrichum higginsianum]
KWGWDPYSARNRENERDGGFVSQAYVYIIQAYEKLVRNVSKTEVKGVEENNDRLVSPRPRPPCLSRVVWSPWRAPGIRTCSGQSRRGGRVPGHLDSGAVVSNKQTH